MGPIEDQDLRLVSSGHAWRWGCSCGMPSGRWYRSEAEALKAGRRHIERNHHSPDLQSTVYVRLLGEGVDVWRPVRGEVLGGRRFRLLPTDDYDPEAETWEFLPGVTVECEPQELSDGTYMVAKRAVSN